VNAVANVSGYGGLAVASVDDTFVAFHVDFDICFAETAPMLLDIREQALLYVRRCIFAARKVLLKKRSIAFLVAFYADELRVEAVVGQSWFRTLLDDAADFGLMEKFEVVSFVWSVGNVK
jgi:hypothetical protein